MEPTEDGEEYSSSYSSKVDALKREVNSSTVAGAAKSDWRMCLVA
jgi:hypothetical protein